MRRLCRGGCGAHVNDRGWRAASGPNTLEAVLATDSFSKLAHEPDRAMAPASEMRLLASATSLSVVLTLRASASMMTPESVMALSESASVRSVVFASSARNSGTAPASERPFALRYSSLVTASVVSSRAMPATTSSFRPWPAGGACISANDYAPRRLGQRTQTSGGCVQVRNTRSDPR